MDKNIRKKNKTDTGENSTSPRHVNPRRDSNKQKFHKQTKHVERNPIRSILPESDQMDLPNIEDQGDVGKDFQSLADIPLTSDHFIPKSEKHWSINVSHFSEFFSLDPKVLSAAIGCIPFNDYMGVNPELFTPDQLTQIHNTVDESKVIYQNILLDLDKLCEETSDLSMDSNSLMKQQDTFERKVEESNPEIEDEDLDFLLTLKEPVRSDQVSIPPLSTSHTDNVKSQEVPSKSVDLEKWLDSILDD